MDKDEYANKVAVKLRAAGKVIGREDDVLDAFYELLDEGYSVFDAQGRVIDAFGL